MEYQIEGIDTDFVSREERARLVGLCRTLTGNADIAEDLAQETLLLAWRGIEGLREPQKRAQWIAGIARNVTLRWLRQQGRDEAHTLLLPQHIEENNPTSLEELVADEFDLEIELEHKELVALLDRALALLPPETRTVLIKRYIEESPLTEIATQLQTRPGAVAMRLQRGKLALRKILSNEMQEEVAAYEQAAHKQMWQQTSLWCQHCGNHHLLGYKEPEHGLLYLKCPRCHPDNVILSRSEGVSALKGVKSFKPAYARLGEWCHTHYRQGLQNGSMDCEKCGGERRFRISFPAEIRELGWLDNELPAWLSLNNTRLVNGICARCLSINCISLDALALFLPEGRAFLRAHPRIRQLPQQTLEFAGRPAVLIHFESVTECASFEVISDYETFQVLKVIEDAR